MSQKKINYNTADIILITDSNSVGQNKHHATKDLQELLYGIGKSLQLIVVIETTNNLNLIKTSKNIF